MSADNVDPEIVVGLFEGCEAKTRCKVDANCMEERMAGPQRLHLIAAS
jgi:hypothetical protein